MKRVLVVLLIVVMLFSICGCKKDSEAIQQDSEMVQEIPDAFFYKSDEETFEISTPYATLCYPTEWKNMIKTDVAETDGTCKVTFVALLDDIEVPLYAIVFGESETENLIGELPLEEGAVNVYCEDYTEGSTELLTEESADTYLMMSEDINVIISNLVYSNGLIII